MAIGGIIYGFYHWYNKFYFETDNDGRCVVSGYDYELQINSYYNINKYQCLPILLVDYEIDGKLFSNIKTYTFEKNEINKGIIFDNFTEAEKTECLAYYSIENNYKLGQNIKHCYYVKSNKQQNPVCRIDGRMNNNCCNDGLMFFGFFIIVSIACVIVLLIILYFMILITHDTIFSNNQQQISPLMVQPVQVNQPTIFKPTIVPLKKAYICDKCSLCEENDSELIFRPCGHICVCKSCYDCMADNKCPVCNGYIETVFVVMEEITMEV